MAENSLAAFSQFVLPIDLSVVNKIENTSSWPVLRHSRRGKLQNNDFEPQNLMTEDAACREPLVHSSRPHYQFQ